MRVISNIMIGAAVLVLIVAAYFTWMYLALHLLAWLDIGTCDGNGIVVGNKIVGSGSAFIATIAPFFLVLLYQIGKSIRGQSEPQ